MTDMKRNRFSEEQIIGYLKQAKAGIEIKELCRQDGFSDPTRTTHAECLYRELQWQILR